MKLLAIDTSFEACSVALAVGDDVEERYTVEPRSHATHLLPWVEELLASAALALGSLDAIAFARGPGSFTSLRIGIGVVQGLAFGAELPVVPVSSLRLTAQTAARVSDDGVMHDPDAPVLVAMDARMDEVYAGRFRSDGGVQSALGAERVLPAADVAGLLQPCDRPVGNGFERYAALAAATQMPVTNVWPRAAALVPLALDWLAENAALSPERAQPVYLRDRVAEKPRDRG